MKFAKGQRSGEKEVTDLDVERSSDSGSQLQT